LFKPISLDGIAGGIDIHFIGTALFETLNLKGDVIPFKVDLLLSDIIPVLLISPQAFLSKNRSGESVGKLEDHFRILHARAEWRKDGAHLLTMGFDSSLLPRITLFHHGKAQPTLKAVTSVLHSACQVGKQVRVPDGTTTIKNNPESEGGLLKGAPYVGSMTCTYHLVSKVKERLLHTAGRKPDQLGALCSSVFHYENSGNMHFEHQVTVASTCTIMAKNNDERMTLSDEIVEETYRTDNGVYNSQTFAKDLQDNYQSVQFSGVGARWQNNAAEATIGSGVSKATPILHVSLHCMA
jgi:hypothetical protein